MNANAATYKKRKNIYKVAWIVFSSAQTLTVLAAFFSTTIVEQEMYILLFLIPVILFSLLSVRFKRKMRAFERAENKEKAKVVEV